MQRFDSSWLCCVVRSVGGSGSPTMIERQELAKSPPFEDIARQNGFNAEMLAYLILAPHPRMNLTFTREEAEDLAAYIVSLHK
jgi:hypothetical protein